MTCCPKPRYSRRAFRLTRLEDRTVPALATWDGSGTTNFWSDPQNWVGDVAPQPGDDVAFPAGAARLNNVNDFPAGTAFGQIRITANAYQIGGNAVILAGGLNTDLPFGANEPDSQVGLPITLAADQTFSQTGSFGRNLTVTGAIDLAGHTLSLVPTHLTLAGPVGGTGSLSVTGIGQLFLTGANSFTGPTTVSGTPTQSPILQVDGSAGDVILTNAVLSGRGRTGSVTGSPGFIQPGNYPGNSAALTGTLNVGDFNLKSGSFLTMYGGAHDQIVAHGTVRLDGSLTFGFLAPYPVPPGSSFTVIDNDGTDPVQGTFRDMSEGAMFLPGVRITYRGGDGNDVVVTVMATPQTAVSAGPGGLPVVNVYDQVGGLMRSFLAYDAAFRGGVHVAVADVTGDGVKDIITAPGSGGGPHIKVFDGVTGALVRQWMAYAPVFRGGVFVAAAPINKEDDVADIVTGAGPGGGPHVKVFDGATGAVMSSFMAYDPAFTGGVNLAAVRKTTFSYVSGSGSVFYEIPGRVVTGTGPGGGPHVRIFDGTTGQVQGEFFAWPHNPNGLGWVVGYSGGVNVAADYPSSGGNSSLYIVAGAGPGVQPEVQVFDSAGNLSSRFLAYSADFRGGVTVDILPDPTFSGMPPSIITGTGPGGGPHVREWRVPPDLGYNHADAPADLKREFFAFDPAFRGGVFVG